MKTPARYACQECGAVHPKWAGRCDSCGAWNSLVEEVPRAAAPKGLGRGAGGRGGRALDFVGLRGAAQSPPRPRPFGGAARGSSSTMLFQAPQASHRPAHLGASAPHSWQA